MQAGSVGSITVTGPGSRWNISALYGGVAIGEYGSGTLTIQNGGTVVNSTLGVTLGVQSGSSGTMTVSGSGSQYISSSGLGVGLLGTASLTVSNGGIINSLGVAVQNNSSITVNGPGSQLNAGSSTIDVGGGNLTMSQGASGSAGSVYSDGTMILTDPGTNLNAGGGFVFIGVYQDGTLTVKNGAVLSQGGQLVLGCCIGSYTGSLNIDNGGVVNTTTAWIGPLAGENGNILVSGTGSQWNSSGQIFLGSNPYVSGGDGTRSRQHWWSYPDGGKQRDNTSERCSALLCQRNRHSFDPVFSCERNSE